MKNKRILFIGDSITEWGRFEDPANIGENYVRIIRDTLAIHEPNQFPEIINRGIGGDRVTDLVARWQEDAIEINPDVLSISVGINEVWRQIDQSDVEQVYPDKFEHLYTHLIEKTQAETDAEIILMEPTVIEEDPQSKGNQILKDYVEIVNKLAEKYQLTLVPTHQVFLDYLNSTKPLPLTIDGVHMSSTGDQLMAKAWLDTINK
ncbi:SGNH/GDSL hydrolase family protein [Amphibacillus sp. MSJ-3]|uniref:SGNH/GDSL hydrolase family protein n=1 Tax=Amphibacillus sp. MSJ-3 TaxID=2841505 RepID=UPI001C0E94BD|nr:SGNH/GDSL hydrolase family protein [Amphibacillus sp. MSJ-3]MBU5595737.1 SGNH/GDSL hydrolase family protein [Amphibacillus sp. MSJ-3]